MDWTVQEMRRDAWRYLVEKLELRRVMSHRAWTELEQQLEKGEPPPVTEETVMGMARGYMAALPGMFEDAVLEVFEWLRPGHDRYKTNQKYEVGERVILTWMVERSGWPTAWRVDYRQRQRLSALERVFSALDGRGLVGQEHYAVLDRAIQESPSGVGETDYFAFRCCRNRNLHLRFKRLDLLAQLNKIAGGKRLRGPSAA